MDDRLRQGIRAAYQGHSGMGVPFCQVHNSEKRYTGMCSDARRIALVRMLQEAEQLDADAVYNVRFETSTVNSGEKRKSSGGVELIAYGTAVKRLTL